MGLGVLMTVDEGGWLKMNDYDYYLQCGKKQVRE